MKRHILLIQLFRIPIDAIVLFFAFYASREIRQISHLFSGLQLQEHTLSFSDLNNLLFLAIFAWYFVAIV
jgi:hypothetical protein